MPHRFPIRTTACALSAGLLLAAAAPAGAQESILGGYAPPGGEVVEEIPPGTPPSTPPGAPPPGADSPPLSPTAPGEVAGARGGPDPEPEDVARSAPGRTPSGTTLVADTPETETGTATDRPTADRSTAADPPQEGRQSGSLPVTGSELTLVALTGVGLLLAGLGLRLLVGRRLEETA